MDILFTVWISVCHSERWELLLGNGNTGHGLLCGAALGYVFVSNLFCLSVCVCVCESEVRATLRGNYATYCNQRGRKWLFILGVFLYLVLGNLPRNVLWLPNLVRRTLDRSVIHSWGQRTFLGKLHMPNRVGCRICKKRGRVSKFVKRGGQMADIAWKRAEFA